MIIEFFGIICYSVGGNIQVLLILIINENLDSMCKINKGCGETCTIKMIFLMN